MPDSKAIRGLHFAVRLRVVAKYLGQAFLLLATLTCVPAAVAGVNGNTGVALRYLAIIFLVLPRLLPSCHIAAARTAVPWSAGGVCHHRCYAVRFHVTGTPRAPGR